MSMLAERKQKQKWVLHYNSNKINDWSKDANKFGQKMLERMGWKEGKGLGRNEDGLTEHVKVCYKGDSKGIGFKDSVEWSLQQDNFKALLEELSTTDVEHKTPQVKSLEEKSQSSRARVHYRKFTRAKDLATYSEKDLANIFGRKKLKCDEPEKKVVEEKESTITTGIVMIEGGSMADYFKNKKVNVNKNESEGDHMSYEFGVNSEAVKEDSKVGKTKKKLKNEDSTFISYINNSNNNDNNTKASKIEQAPVRVSKKRKCESVDELNLKKLNKKLKRKDCDLGIVNSAFEPLGNNIVIKKHVLDTINENDSENEPIEHSKIEEVLDETPVEDKKKKKLKLKGLDNPALNTDDGYEATVNNQAAKSKKKKVKGVDNLALKLSDSDSNNTSQPDPFLADKLERKRHKRTKSQGIDNPALALNDSSNQEATENNPDSNHIVKRKNTSQPDPFLADKFERKRTKRTKSQGIDNPALTLNDSNKEEATEDNPDSNHIVKHKNTSQPDPFLTDKLEKKKNKRMKSQGIDNPALTLNDSNNQEAPENNPDFNHIVKRKKKKKSTDSSGNDTTQLVENGIENPALEISDCDLILNVTNEPVEPKPVKVKQKSKRERFLKQRFDGQDNKGFDAKTQHIEERVNEMTKTINNFQAEVENDINETKAIRGGGHEEFMIGELNCSDGENETHKDGIKLKLKHAKFNRNEPYWQRRNDALTAVPRKSYKHLIRGDIIVGFKNSNLHTITGYGVKSRH